MAERISQVSHGDREIALEAAKRSYQQTALDLNYAEPEANLWVFAVIKLLRANLEKQQAPADDRFETA